MNTPDAGNREPNIDLIKENERLAKLASEQDHTIAMYRALMKESRNQREETSGNATVKARKHGDDALILYASVIGASMLTGLAALPTRRARERSRLWKPPANLPKRRYC